MSDVLAAIFAGFVTCAIAVADHRVENRERRLAIVTLPYSAFSVVPQLLFSSTAMLDVLYAHASYRHIRLYEISQTARLNIRNQYLRYFCGQVSLTAMLGIHVRKSPYPLCCMSLCPSLPDRFVVCPCAQVSLTALLYVLVPKSP